VSWLLGLWLLAGADPHATLSEARHRFEQGDYAGTSALLRPLIDRDVFVEAGDRNEALRLHGVASFLGGRRGDAEGAFLALLAHEPAARLAAGLYPPDVVAFFDAIRARREAELARTAGRARKRLVLALVPFGVGQFQNGDRRKGWLLFGLESALTITATTSFILLLTSEQPGHTFDDTGDARTLKNVNLVSGVLLAATCAYGLVDALYYYRRDRDVTDAPRSGAPAPRLALLPLPGGAFAGASWGF
jgi:hypothetical protein